MRIRVMVSVALVAVAAAGVIFLGELWSSRDNGDLSVISEVQKTEPIQEVQGNETNVELQQNKMNLESQVAQEGVLHLADFNYQDDETIYELIETRVAANRFTDREISFETRSKIIWATHGMTYSGGEKTVGGLDAVSSATEVPRYTINPAARERHIHIYYLSDEGSYEYVPEENLLERISENNLHDIASTSRDNSQFHILLTVDEKVFSFGKEWAYLAVGSSIQNVNLVANSEDVYVFTRGYFNDSELSRELGLKSSEEPVVLLSFGYIE